MSVLAMQLDDEADRWRTDEQAVSAREKARIERRIRDLEARVRAIELRLDAVRWEQQP